MDNVRHHKKTSVYKGQVGCTTNLSEVKRSRAELSGSPKQFISLNSFLIAGGFFIYTFVQPSGFPKYDRSTVILEATVSIRE